MPDPTRRIDVLERIMRRVDRRGPVPDHRPDLGPCWVWGGRLTRHGYGQVTISAEEGRALVHRIVFMRLVGPIGHGLELDHLCRRPACCNPRHLDPVTHLVNVRRGMAAATVRARHAARTHCAKGHEYTPQNTAVTPRGARRCRTCNRDWVQAKRDARKAARSEAVNGDWPMIPFAGAEAAR